MLKADSKGIHNVVSIDGISPANTCGEASPFNTLAAPAKLDNGLHTDGCPSLPSVNDE